MIGFIQLLLKEVLPPVIFKSFTKRGINMIEEESKMG